MSVNNRACRVGFASVLALGLAATLTTGTASADSTSSEPLNYVNLGDSYSAGSGVLPLAKGSNPLCLQSERNFAHNLAVANDLDLTDVSCGAAQTKHFADAQYPGVAPQLDALSADTDLVTMTIGGNDNSTFISAILACGASGLLTLGKGNPCEKTFGDRFTETIRNSTYGNLVGALKAVQEKAPNARIAISGYPWITPKTGGCFPLMPVAEGDVPYLRDLQSTLNDAVERAAQETGVTYVDQSAASEGHDACQSGDQRWVEPVLGTTQFVPVHPNARGERGMGEEFAKALQLELAKH